MRERAIPVRESQVAFEAVTALSFDEAAARRRAELAREGFGVLTEIDLQAKLKEKLGVEVPPNLILGACHPPSAHRALQAVPEVSVLLPCNVAVAVEARGGTCGRCSRRKPGRERGRRRGVPAPENDEGAWSSGAPRPSSGIWASVRRGRR